MAFKQEKFKMLIEHKSGYTWGKEQELDKPEQGAVRVLTVTNIQEKLDLSSELYLKDVKDRDKKEKSVNKDWTIAVSSNGNRKRIGNAVFVKDDTDYLFASFLTAFKPKIDADITPEYFFQWFSSHMVQERITAVSEGTTGLGNLDIRYLRNMDIEYPDNEAEQKAIAKILSKVDEAIKASENSIKAAEILKKSLMQNLFTGKLKPDGKWRKDIDLQKTAYGLIAKDWRYCKIQDLIKDNFITEVKDGNHGESHPISSEFVTEGIPFIMASDISGGFIDFVNCKKIPVERAKKLRIGFSIKDDVLLSHKASMGFTAIVPDVDPYIMLTPQVTYYRCNKEKLLPEYLGCFFQTYKFQRLFETYSAQSTRNFMGITNQKKMHIYLPNTIEEQEQIISPISDVHKQIVAKHEKIKKLQKLKKSLMQNLLTGKVRVDVNKIETLLQEQ
jgi:type I restriction enzyme, S subunit